MFPEIPDDFAFVGDLSPSEYADAHTIARQARTIRRLRALADGYRAMMQRAEMPRSVSVAKDVAAKERARIVANMRGFASGCVDRGDDRTGGEVYALSDAIERGEL